MNLQEYANSRRKKTPGVDAVERWNTRIVPQGLHTQGLAGANQYINIYGKTMGAPKTIALACQADAMGYPEVAVGFWQHAAYLEGVVISHVGNILSTAPVAAQIATSRMVIEDFPSNMQPGMIATMQPCDGKLLREHYAGHPGYWGHRKRDGHKWLVFGTPDQAWYQSRSTKLKCAPSIEFERTVKAYARENSSFITEGELYFLDWAGNEHKTAPQAMTANAEAGKLGVPPLMKYMPFIALFTNGKDLRDDTYAVRVLHANAIARGLADIDRSTYCRNTFEVCETFRTAEEKFDLIRMQKRDGREGEIWFDPTRIYESGKHTDDSIVRTKYIDTLPYVVIGLTPTTAAGRLFGALEVVDLDGNSVGSVGTGFDRVTQAEIKRLFCANGKVDCLITHQGFSEAGQLIHGRFDGFR